MSGDTSRNKLCVAVSASRACCRSPHLHCVRAPPTISRPQGAKFNSTRTWSAFPVRRADPATMLSNDDTQQIRQGYLAVLGTPAVGQASRYLLRPRTSSQRRSMLRQARKVRVFPDVGFAHTSKYIHRFDPSTYSFTSPFIALSLYRALPKMASVSTPIRRFNSTILHPWCAGAEVTFRWRIIFEAVCTTIPCSTRHSGNVASPSRYLEIA